jgi:hypothetical protein
VVAGCTCRLARLHPANIAKPLEHDSEKREPVFGKDHAQTERIMRAEIERLVEEIKQSVGLLRRHL